jgi:hypothetical protein
MSLRKRANGEQAAESRREAELKSLLYRLLRNFGPELNLQNSCVRFACAFVFVGHWTYLAPNDTGTGVGRG